MPEKKNAIVIVFNSAFVLYARALINSIKVNWPSHPEILLFLNNDVNLDDEMHFKSITGTTIFRYNPNNLSYRSHLIDSDHHFGTKQFHDNGFFIINFWDDILSEYNDVLILDADTLVLKNLDHLMNDESFFAASAANERFLPVFSINQPFLPKMSTLFNSYLKALKMGIYLKPMESINSGVIRLSVKDRSKNDFKNMVEILKIFRPLCSSDQEIIYLWMKKYNRKISFDFRYNFQVRFFNEFENKSLPNLFLSKIEEAINDIHILHYNGPKPDSTDFLNHPWTKGQSHLIDLFQSYN